MPTIQMPSISTAKTVLSAAASLAASAVLVRTIVNEFLPRQIQDYIFYSASSFATSLSSKLTITVQEFHGILPNEMYKAAETYLSTKISPSARCLQVAKQEDSKGLEVTMEQGETITDIFEGIEFRWKLICHEKEKSVLNRHRSNNPFMNMTLMLETKYFVLSFHKKQKDKALTVYLPHILQQFKNIKQEEKTIKIHTANYENMYHGMMTMDFWHGVHLDHPATFETLAMDPEQKRAVKEDLERFVRRKTYYRRVGKAWKRGYLLYGPPGTGKSSLIAAIANFLKFDIYDLELTEVRSNSALRKLLVGTANRSILVVEDIDCTIDLQEREEKNDAAEPRNRRNEHDDKVTLSGLLNFIDGLWSSCGDERIIIFTTNHKERLDSALLRPGRMDMHIHMSYCSPSGFKTLLLNYHNVDGHALFPEVEMLLEETQATPAEVAEELMKSDDIEFAMRSLMRFLVGKKAEASEATNKAEASEASKKVEASEAAKKEVSIKVEDSEFEEVKKSGEQDEQE